MTLRLNMMFRMSCAVLALLLAGHVNAVISISASTNSPAEVVPPHTVQIDYAPYTDEPFVGFYWFSLYVNGVYHTGQSEELPFTYEIAEEGQYEFIVETSTGGNLYRSSPIVITAEIPRETGTEDPVGTHVGPLFAPMIDVYGNPVPEWQAGVEGGIPDVAVVANALDFGAVANDAADDAVAIQAAIDSVAGTGAVLVPAGVYDLYETITLKDGVVLRGEGMKQTEFHIYHEGDAFQLKGYGERSTYGFVDETTDLDAVVSGADKGSLRILVEDASDYDAGDFIEIVQTYDPSLHETTPQWRAEWAGRLIGHFTQIEIVDGNWLTLKDPVRTDMDHDLGVWFGRVHMPEYIGYEDFTVERKSVNDARTFHFNLTSNVWIKGVHSENTDKAHVAIFASRHVEVRDSIFRLASDYGSGGHGYGVELALRSSACLIVNNALDTLRHALMAHIGANGNVVSHNYSINPYQDTGGTWLPTDLSMHGHYPYSNLFEQNMVNISGATDYWGPVGPDNVYLRNNFAMTSLDGSDHTNLQYVIGNRFQREMLFDQAWGIPGFNFGDPADYQDTVDESTWVDHFNYKIDSGLLSEEAGYEGQAPVTSYFYAQAPSFMAGFDEVSVGYDVAQPNLPAKDMYELFLAQFGSSDSDDSGDDTTVEETPATLAMTVTPADDRLEVGDDIVIRLAITEGSQVLSTVVVTVGTQDYAIDPAAPELTVAATAVGDLVITARLETTSGQVETVSETLTVLDELIYVAPTLSVLNAGPEGFDVGDTVRIGTDELTNDVFVVANLYVNGIWQTWNTTAPFEYDFIAAGVGIYELYLTVKTVDDVILSTNTIEVLVGDPIETYLLGSTGVSCTSDIASDWPSGFHATITLQNTAATPISAWDLNLHFPNGVTAVDISPVESTGLNHVYVSNTVWNGDLNSGESVTLNIYADKADTTTAAAVVMSGGVCE